MAAPLAGGPQSRGPQQLNFESGEKVLCYEPDPTKVKIIYDAKILAVQVNLDERGKNQSEYLVHFQGWHSGWDRYVLEDLLLKDTPENREEQAKLYKEADEYKVTKKKKQDRRTSEVMTRISIDSIDSEYIDTQNDDASSVVEIEEQKLDPNDEETEPKRSSPPEVDSSNNNDHGGEALKVPEDEEDEEEVNQELIPLILPESLKKRLIDDHNLVNRENRCVKLPAQPNIVTLLETYVRNFAISKLVNLERNLVKGSTSSYSLGKKHQMEKEAELYDEVMTAINICKEVAESVRIVVDFHLGNILLYPGERDQFNNSTNLRPHMENIERQVVGAGELLEASQSVSPGEGEGAPSEQGSTGRKRRSVARAETEGSASSGTATPTGDRALAGQGNNMFPATTKSMSILKTEVLSWKLVPESVYFSSPCVSSLVYGGVHLARLLTKLPELLLKMRVSVSTAKQLTKYLEYLVEFIDNQQDIFSEANYET